MGDEALLLAPDDGDMDFGDINCDLLDEDDESVSDAESKQQEKNDSDLVGISNADSQRHKMDMKKIRYINTTRQFQSIYSNL